MMDDATTLFTLKKYVSKLQAKLLQQTFATSMLFTQ